MTTQATPDTLTPAEPEAVAVAPAPTRWSRLRAHPERGASVSVMAAGLLVAAGATPLASFLFFVPPFHMYRQLRGAYQLGRFGALWRAILLVSFAFVAASLFMVAIVGLGVL